MILRPGTFLQDRYEILEQIGSGGMSDVYKALCHKLNRLVAIKVLKEEFSSDSNFVSKFKMEAQSAARLSHPNIVNIYDVVDEGDLHFIVMELIEGITLKNYIMKKGCLDIKEAIGIAMQVAQGIAAAHEQGIIHRDIKPQNIIIARDGKVKVADFGIARAASSQTMSATAVGSVHYISPEQARGGYSDVRSDIYSLGITLYEMVAGRVPFQGDNTVTVALAHLEAVITPPSYFNEMIPVALENIILKSTEKKPEYRYGNMYEVISDLRKALVNPNGDFVQNHTTVDDSQTIIIGKPELEQIRSGRKPQQEPPMKRASSGEEYGQNHQPSSNYDEQSGSGRKRRNHTDEDINPKIEKLLTAAGVVTAIIIVVILAVVFSKISGLFRSGSGEETVSTAAISTEETLSEKTVKMPDVSGLDSDTAEKKLKDNGDLYMKVSEYQFSDTVDKGDVISQDPVADKVVDKYSAVYVVISKGPEHVAIDLSKLGLETMDSASAKSLLESKGLVVNVEQKNSDTVTAGNVISYSPSEAKEGETVSLFSSSGPTLVNPVVVPNLEGQKQEVAVEMLADVGLVQGTVTEASSETVARGCVISQSALPGSQVESQTAVDFVVSTGNSQESKYKYLASINESFSLQNIIGPGSGSTQLTLKIQLRQSVDGQDSVKKLMDPVTLNGDQLLPVSFKNIEGAYGVTSGSVEIVNVDTGEVVNSYAITFVPVPQS
ncbi:Stk1 family PASTA domain-containing Ser/Thr kinase [Clostridium boliviensis]|uniref:non-specific serine/threonine protein kinase n=1 Tax=Clostridium boliviensis TaxID=318465 RepID=A0ABU4GFN9_9CLOT|nr:Stk1 family PASTA domain-containing Ser/Thr kinase [Clostridium boliviensis]MDW2796446.1 Stk1 family PASTA domain-containing Ser/Thr kinase [Clostridium boliviensis]